jgi:hypothetical protein
MVGLAAFHLQPTPVLTDLQLVEGEAHPIHPTAFQLLQAREDAAVVVLLIAHFPDSMQTEMAGL